ncbi:hypothetical protein WA026_002667 [Henosepilachna vigintioctopunctata]|uniref:Transmembrane protein 53 n=1 Tax=Henosepilachna vigintioctopunctata TaxID=420089 RepID=A0AAW1TVF7_9CUCU
MTVEEKFGCIVTHPDPNFDYTKKNVESDDFVITLKREDVPIVFLLGWSGALDKHLAVYSKLYEEKGFITMRYICPVVYNLFQYHKMDEVAKNIANFFIEPNFQNKNIIFHVFSNGGSFQYEFVVKALDENSTSSQIKGVIFDSAPGVLSFSSVYGAVNSMKRESYTPWIKAESFVVVASHFARKLFNRFYGKLINKKIYEFNPIVNLRNEKNRCPQHFIYSKGDLLVPYQEVEQFWKHRKSLGVDVTTQVYADTPHVRHYPYNKLNYKRSIFQFVSKCLRR